MSKFLQYTVLIAASLLATGAAHSQPDNIFVRTVGQHGFMDSDWYICPSWDVYLKFQKLLSEDAEAAFVLADRDCIKVRDQTEVVVVDTSYLSWRGHGAVCVRPIGQPDCGWVLPGAVTAALCKDFYDPKDRTMKCLPRKDRDNPQRPWSLGFSGK